LAIEPLANVAFVGAGVASEFRRRLGALGKSLVEPKFVPNRHENSVDCAAEIDERSAKKFVKLVVIQCHVAAPTVMLDGPS
jgi:hypothetical protein